ncbi:hypothetical protein CANCADRAFT_142951 [Tortispora caseinolytica NRRL Y-17796]|uniref:Uncharacterized protein n=1 Tax=Tortispora caseinolytica NRRL Y-17796 TaxID=767744 RepID=A0A1E4TDE1_9ASCO|nr:hypothetical protein CANCADRAFT_142951 [Tortispora caseinolytica NRRL Y-17796]
MHAISRSIDRSICRSVDLSFCASVDLSTVRSFDRSKCSTLNGPPNTSFTLTANNTYLRCWCPKLASIGVCCGGANSLAYSAFSSCCYSKNSNITLFAIGVLKKVKLWLIDSFSNPTTCHILSISRPSFYFLCGKNYANSSSIQPITVYYHSACGKTLSSNIAFRRDAFLLDTKWGN